jgi:hypothetical protein
MAYLSVHTAFSKLNLIFQEPIIIIDSYRYKTLLALGARAYCTVLERAYY